MPYKTEEIQEQESQNLVNEQSSNLSNSQSDQPFIDNREEQQELVSLQAMADKGTKDSYKQNYPFLFDEENEQEGDGTQLIWLRGTRYIKEKADGLRAISKIFDELVTRLENNSTDKITVRVFGEKDKSDKGDNKVRGGIYDPIEREIVNKADATEEQIIEEFFHAYQYEFYGAAITEMSKLAHTLNAEGEKYHEEDPSNYAYTELLNTKIFLNGDNRLFVENEAKLFVYLVLNDFGQNKKENKASGLPLKKARDADASNSGRAMKNGLHEELQKDWGQLPNNLEPINSDNNKIISKDFFDTYQDKSKKQMNYMGYYSDDYFDSPHALNSILDTPTEENEEGKNEYDILLNGTTGEYYRRYIRNQ